MSDELIRRRRGQMLVHSYLYYWMDDSLISDDQWQAWANELATLPYKELGFYDEEFKGWTGDTGCMLPRDDWIINKATQLMRYRGND